MDNAVTTVRIPRNGCIVAAGNSNTDAGNTSPARVPSVITVGAITIADARSSASNYGSVVDVYAPGQNIIGAWIGSPTTTNIISGTSPVASIFLSCVVFALIYLQAAAFVAGLVAYLISVHGNLSPAEMEVLVKSLSLNGVLTGILCCVLPDVLIEFINVYDVAPALAPTSHDQPRRIHGDEVLRSPYSRIGADYENSLPRQISRFTSGGTLRRVISYPKDVLEFFAFRTDDEVAGFHDMGGTHICTSKRVYSPLRLFGSGDRSPYDLTCAFFAGLATRARTPTK
ncbi:subtilisin serine protease [Salix suchowensis]|nr:subtilisin serine protease [Salix suchowensis]